MNVKKEMHLFEVIKAMDYNCILFSWPNTIYRRQIKPSFIPASNAAPSARKLLCDSPRCCKEPFSRTRRGTSAAASMSPMAILSSLRWVRDVRRVGRHCTREPITALRHPWRSVSSPSPARPERNKPRSDSSKWLS